MPERACYFAAECAELLGMSRDTFYRQFDDLLARGMPPSKTGGRYRVDKIAFNTWRRSPKAPKPPANDDGPVRDRTDDEHRADLAREYATTR